MNYYLGIDGGGTKTEFVLCDERGFVLKTLIKGGSNPNDIGIEESVKLLVCGISEIASDIENLYVYAGISGAGVGENAIMIENGIASFCKKARVQTDLFNAVECALKDSDGVAVICGTGISCALKEGENLKIVGGYGYLFEDGGSGYAYGRDGVKAVLRYEDGYGEKTILADTLKSKTAGNVHSRLRELLLGGKALIASFAPLVFDGFYQGDSVCERIVNDNICQMLALTQNALTVFGKKECALAFVGGVTKQPYVREKIQEKFSTTEIIFTSLSPVYGAVRRAVKLNEEVDEHFENNFVRSYRNA